MNKHMLLIGVVAALVFGIGSADAQSFAAAAKNSRASAGTIGQPPPPPVLESCMSMPDGSIECQQTICEEVGSNLKECITYTFKRDSYDP